MVAIGSSGPPRILRANASPPSLPAVSGSLARYLALQPDERTLLREAFRVVLGVRITLWIVPVRRILKHAAARSAEAGLTGPEAERVAGIVAWSVRVASRRIPGASCLTQAISGQIMLARRGVPSVLHLGMARNPDGGMLAHAWLDCQGRTVLGGQRSAQYAAFPRLDAALGLDAATPSREPR